MEARSGRERGATLGHVFLSSAARCGERPALWITGQSWNYTQLLEMAAGLACQLTSTGAAATGRPCAIYAQRSLCAYVGILAAQLSGLAFVPLNPRFPSSRTKAMIGAARPVALITDARQASRLAAVLLDAADDVPLIIVPDLDQKDVPRDLVREGRTCLGRNDVPPISWSGEPSGGSTDTAYIMFTSGTTGLPKGVRVVQSNVLSYLSAIEGLIRLESDDRATQFFDLTFDLSVHDLFVTWAAGACLYVFQDAELLAPLSLVQRHRLTSWFSVPTVAALARPHLRSQPGALESLRYSLFCGEPLAQDLAREWQRAAPSSALFNLYGPTETTIAVTAFRLDLTTLPTGPTVPIGSPFPGQTVAVVDDNCCPVADDEIGELLVAGPQVSAGYINDDAASHSSFFEGPIGDGVSRRWYRTGDLVRHDDTGGLIFQGRRDLQVKINGYRVELFEVEAALRQASGCDLVAAVPWPLLEAGGARGLVGVLCGCGTIPADLIRRCAALLPVYMVPRQILTIDDMPLNSNGKVDRHALLALCAARSGQNTR